MLTPDDRAALELLRDLHGIHASEQEFAEYLQERNRFLSHLRSQHATRLSEQGIDDIPDVQDKEIGGLIGAAIGVALFFSGVFSGVGLATLVAIGASVGYQVGSLLDPPNIQAQNEQKSNKQKQSRNAYGFDSVSTLVTYGEAIPALYTNKDINPNGGIRTTGYLIDQRVDTRNGAQTLIQKYIICEGPIGAISEAKTLFDNQPISAFFRNEITQEFRLGYDDQTPFSGDSGVYSNAVTLSANQTCGCDLRSLVESTKVKRRDILAEPEIMFNGYDATRRTKTIDFEKARGVYAKFVSEEALKVREGKNDSGFVEGTALSNTVEQYIGIVTTKNNDNTVAEFPFCFRLNEDGTWDIVESGTVRAVTGVFDRRTSFAVEYLGRSVVYRVDKSVVYTSSLQPVYPARLGVLIRGGTDSNGTKVIKLYVGRNISYAKGRIRPSDTTIIEVDEDSFEKFTPSDIYRVRGKRFQIVGKNSNASTIEVDDVLNLREDDQIFAIWEASFQTSRQVNRIDVNFAARLWARNPRGELIKHGMVFDVYLKPQGLPWQFLQRLYISNNVDVDVRRSIKIKGLPLNYYQVELRPVERPNGAHPIKKLGDSGNFISVNVGSIGASQITLESQFDDDPPLDKVQTNCAFDGIFDDPDDDADMDEDELEDRKRQVCSQQGPTLRITSINEIVIGPALNYPGLVLAKLTFKASERMTSSPTPSFLITKGLIDRIHIAAGNAASNATTTLGDLTANFLADGVQVGYILRNLDLYIEAPITAVAATTLTTAVSLGWTKGDRYLVYTTGSSCYFPDIYMSRLGHDHGVGAMFNTDEFADYPSIIDALKFAQARRFFCDARLKEQMKLNQWVQQEAPASLMIASIIGGMRALVPEQEEPVQGLFTAANAADWKEAQIDFTKRQTNRVIVTYTDGSDEFKLKTVVIMTPDAYHKRVPWSEESITYPSITYKQQAVYVGALLLKSRLIQDRTADWSTGLYGCYVRPGALVHCQHTVTEWLDEKSGVILGANLSTPGNYSLQISATFDGSITRSTYRATIKYRADGHTDYDRPCAINNDAVIFKVFVQNCTRVPQPGDWIALGEDREERRTFRLSSVEPTEEISTLQMNAIYWHPDILNLNDLYIDGICQGATVADSVIDEAEMRGWLSGMDLWTAENTRNTAPFIINSSNILVNAYHGTADESQLGRAGYFAAASFTSEGQFTAIEASAFVYQVTGVASWRNRAIAMGEAAVNVLYGGDPIPTNTQTVWLPHWLGNAGAPFTSKGLVASDPENNGHFDVPVTFTNGTGQLSAGQSASLLADVYIVRTPGSKLLWRSVTSSVIPDSASLPINYWVSSIGGQRYRIYSTSASSSGTAPTLTAEPLGLIRLVSNYSGTGLVNYSSYSGPVIQQNQLYDAAPMWRPLEPGERNCAMDVVGWAWQSYHLLYLLTSDSKWLRARDASAYSLIQTAQIENLSHYHKKSDNTEVFSYPGSQVVIVNNSAGYTASRVTSGDKKDWIQINVANGPEAFPSLEYQNFAVQTQFETKVRIKVEAATSVATMLEVVMSTNPDAFTFTDLYKAYWLVDGGGVPQTITFESEDFIRWRTDTNIVWYPAIAETPIYVFDGDGGSATATREQIKLGGINPVIWKIDLDGDSGFAGAGFVFNGLGAATNNPPTIYLKHEGDNAILRVTDADGRKWDTNLTETDTWIAYSRSWSDFRRASTESGDEDPNTTGNIQAVEIQSSGGSSTTRVYYLSTGENVTPEELPMPVRVYKSALVSKIDTAHTFWIGEFRPLNNDADILPYSPSVIPFTANFLNGVLRAYRGNPYSGYQIVAWLWAQLGLNDRAEQMNQFLRDAQDAYFAKTGVDSFFAPTYVWGYWDSLKYSEDGKINVFSDRGDDPSVFWIGYHVRPLEATAYHLYRNPGSVSAQRIVTRALTWLANHYNTQQSGKPPTNIYYRPNDPIQSLYEEPHACAMIMRAAIFANVSNVDANITYPVIEWSYKYLKSQYVSTGLMRGTFTAGQPTFTTGGQTFRQNFGFWHFEVAKAIALLIQQRANLRYPCG